MYLHLTDEQTFLREAAAAALDRHHTVAAAREALDGADYTDLWPTAVEAGWTGLLSGEDADGAGLTVYEALLVLEACGRRLADARLIGHLTATALLEQAQAPAQLRAQLAGGELRAAYVDGFTVPADDGVVRNVLDAAGADLLVVTGEDGSVGHVAASADGVVVTATSGYDATRALADVDVSAAELTPLHGVAPELGRDLQRALLAAESVGAAEACLTMARDHAIDRNAFGRAIGSYQAIKHKLVEMLRRVEGARSLLVAAGHDAGTPEFATSANAARVTATEALDYAAAENIFIHGGVGATWEHDASVYYRRANLSRRLAGGHEAAALAVADNLLTKVEVYA